MVKELREWWNARGGAPGAKGEVVRRDKEGGVVNEDGVHVSGKLKKVAEMKENTFADLVCEVNPPRPSICVEISISAVLPSRIFFPFPLGLCVFVFVRRLMIGRQNIPRPSIYTIRNRLHPKHLFVLLPMVPRTQRLERSLWEIYLAISMLGWCR